MPLKKQNGKNMYPWITDTWNPIKGKCSHDCEYCYMKAWGEQKPIRLDEKELSANLGEGNFIFVGSSTDMLAPDVPADWIEAVLKTCVQYPKNRYLFQTKNPFRFNGFTSLLGAEGVVLGTTLETNRADHPLDISEAPYPVVRSKKMERLSAHGFKTMVTIEPIIDFDLEPFLKTISRCHPAWVNIGADSKGHSLPEPPTSKIRDLIAALQKLNIDVKIKPNLKRLGVTGE